VAALVDSRGLDAVARLFRDHGVQVAAWSLPPACRAEEAAFAASLPRLADLAALSASLGCHRVITWMTPWSDERPYAENFAWHVDRFQRLAAVLQPHQVRLGIEFIGPKTLRDAHRYPFIFSLDGLRTLWRAIGASNVGVLLDCFHWYTSHGTPADLDRLTNAEVVHVHVNDAVAGRSADEQLDLERCLPGETGLIDIATFLRALQRLDYDGGVAVEPFSQRVNALPPAEAIAATAASLRQIWATAGL
jgi:sugar phosphate isomerase/epimerase